MPVDWSVSVYLPNFDMFARPITVTPVVGAAYDTRGIVDTRDITIQTEEGLMIVSDQETICDVREREFAGHQTPEQGDTITVPVADGVIDDMTGTYVVSDKCWNGGGEVTLVLQRKVVAKP